MFRFKPHNLQMVIFQRQEVLPPPGLLILHQSISLHPKGIINQ